MSTLSSIPPIVIEDNPGKRTCLPMNIESEEEDDEELDSFEEKTDEEPRGQDNKHQSLEEDSQSLDFEEGSDRSGGREGQYVEEILEQEGESTDGYI